MPAEFLSAECHPAGCEIRFRQGTEETTVDAGVLVNCAGPWGTEVIKRVTPAVEGPEVDLVQGAHLLLPPALRHHFYLEAPDDQRAVFALPWKDRLMVGTTETVHKGDPAKTACTPEERAYLVRTLRHYFPDLTFQDSEVESFAGLRVLPRAEGSAFGRSREVLFHADNEDQPRLLSVMGGKLTTYRATAEQVIERLAPSLPRRRPIANTQALSLSPS